MTMDDRQALPVDYLSIPARTLSPYLLNIKPLEGNAKTAREMLLSWDYKLTTDSKEAAIYVAWETEIRRLANEHWIPKEGKGLIGGLQMAKIMNWLTVDLSKFPYHPEKNRDAFLKEAFTKAIASLEKRLGSDMANWQYGQAQNKHSQMNHALGHLVSDSLKAFMNLGPLPRGGNGYTPGASGNILRQSHGASFRIIVNTGDWDATLGTNAPGQSGDPASPFYGNLFESWARDEFFPLYYSKEKIIENQAYRLLLRPGN